MIWVNFIGVDVSYASSMYICICKAVSDSTIRQSVNEGVNTFRELSARTGCGTQCGSCVTLAREVMDQALEATGAPKSIVDLRVVSAT